MGNTSFIVLRTARDEPAAPRTQFAELTGAYWLEPIYAGLANEWNRQGRTVPGTPREQREHRRVLPDGSRDPDVAEVVNLAEVVEVPMVPDVPDVPEGRDGPGSPAGTADEERGLPGAEVPD